MFSGNFQNLLVSSDERPQVLGNTREIGKGLRINSSDGAELAITWLARASDEYQMYGREGRFIECTIDDVENVTRKTISFRDSGTLTGDHDQHFLCVARADAPTKVLVTVARRTVDGTFRDVSRTHQAIGEGPTALRVTIPASTTEITEPVDCDYRFNITTTRPGSLVVQLLDVRYCVT